MGLATINGKDAETILMTETKFYVRVKKGEEWINALRDGQRYVTEAVANDMMDTAQAGNIRAVMFKAVGNETPVIVRRTEPGVEL